MRHLGTTFAGVLLAAAVPAAAAPRASLEGTWNVTATYAGGGSGSGTMRLTTSTGKVAGSAEPLDENQFFPLAVRGVPRGDAAELEMLFRDESVGRVRVKVQGGILTGEGVLYGTLVTIRASRAGAATRAPTIHRYEPKDWQLQYSSRAKPVLRLVSGDKVRTTTLDNEGRDADLKWKAMPGNTLTGPFLVEGAMPGDTLIVRLIRVELNRDSAKMYSGTLDQRAVQGGYAQRPVEGWGRSWSLDRAKGTARLEKPGERLAKLEVPLKPMVGSIGVAPPLNMALYAGDAWIYGGNLDYGRVATGTTLHFPVYRAGAHLFLGDGHALQGDGEISGQGLETSLAVEFEVELVKGNPLGQLWSEDAENVMVHGIDNSLDLALQASVSWSNGASATVIAAGW